VNIENVNIEKSKNELSGKAFLWTRNYTRNLFQMFYIKIKKNLNFRFLLN